MNLCEYRFLIVGVIYKIYIKILSNVGTCHFKYTTLLVVNAQPILNT